MNLLFGVSPFYGAWLEQFSLMTGYQRELQTFVVTGTLGNFSKPTKGTHWGQCCSSNQNGAEAGIVTAAKPGLSAYTCSWAYLELKFCLFLNGFAWWL